LKAASPSSAATAVVVDATFALTFRDPEATGVGKFQRHVRRETAKCSRALPARPGQPCACAAFGDQPILWPLRVVTASGSGTGSWTARRKTTGVLPVLW
jgi:hypothetical protein